MKKLIRSRGGASKGAALIIVLAVMVLATIYNAAACQFIANVQIATAGSSYKVGDTLDPLFGNVCSDNYGFRLRVASVNASGGVTGVTIISGIGYSAVPSNPVRFGGSPTGTGFTATCTFQ